MQTEGLRRPNGGTQLAPAFCDTPIECQEARALEKDKVKGTRKAIMTQLTSNRVRTISKQSAWTAAAMSRERRAERGEHIWGGVRRALLTGPIVPKRC
jgi:hypothetical protein